MRSLYWSSCNVARVADTLTFGKHTARKSISRSVHKQSKRELVPKVYADTNRAIETHLLHANVLALRFNRTLNHSLEEGLLPSNLANLTVCWVFNQTLEKGVSPRSLTHLTFGCT